MLIESIISYHVEDLRERDADVNGDVVVDVDDGPDVAVVVLHEVGQKL